MSIVSIGFFINMYVVKGMCDIIIDFFMFYGAIFSVILAFGQLFQKNKQLISYIYAFSFLCLGIWIFQVSLYSTEVFKEYYLISTFIIPISFLTAPLMSFRYRWVIKSRFSLSRSMFLYSIPFSLSCILLIIPLFIKDISLTSSYLQHRIICSTSFLELPLYFKLIHLMYPLPKIYLVIAMIPTLVQMGVIWKKKRKEHNLTVSRMGYVFSICIILSTALMAAGDFFSTELIRWSVLMANATLTGVFLATQRHPDFNRLLKVETLKARYEHSKINGLDIDRTVQRLMYIMNEEKAFADEEISLSQLADELDIRPQQLSQILNEKLNKNFSGFVNEFRIEEAKKMLLEEPNRSILSIGIAVGFNSATSFNLAFSRYEGCSPGTYRKNNLKQPIKT